MNRIKLILFDLDDTLFNFELFWTEGMKETMRLHPITCAIETENLFQRFKHYSDSLWQQKTTFNEYRQLRLMKALDDFGINVSKEDANNFSDLFNLTYLELIKPTHTINNMLKRLSDRYKLGIITNGAYDTCYKKVIQLKMDDIFPVDSVFISEEVGYSKPHPQIFKLALNHFATESNDALFVGDNWTADIEGAINVGMSTIWINNKKVLPTSIQKPTAIVDTVLDIESLLSLKFEIIHKNTY